MAEVLYLQKLPEFLVAHKQHLAPNVNATEAALQKEHAFPKFFLALSSMTRVTSFSLVVTFSLCLFFRFFVCSCVSHYDSNLSVSNLQLM